MPIQFSSRNDTGNLVESVVERRTIDCQAAYNFMQLCGDPQSGRIKKASTRDKDEEHITKNLKFN